VNTWGTAGAPGPRWPRWLRAHIGLRSGRAKSLPYPVEVRQRDYAAELVPSGGGTEAFDTPEALAINRARLEHLASLELTIERKRVLDVGCGVGHLAQFFVGRGCQVTCVDGRPQNVESLRSRYPRLEAHVLNVETEPLSRLGTFPVVFSYGLVYHLENPLAGLRNMASACKDLLLLETMVCDHVLPLLFLVDETKTVNQALGGLGNRPTPSYVVWALNRIGFPHVYAPTHPPAHPDFQVCWRNSLSVTQDGHSLRCIFVGSRRPLLNSRLRCLIRGG